MNNLHFSWRLNVSKLIIKFVKYYVFTQYIGQEYDKLDTQDLISTLYRLREGRSVKCKAWRALDCYLINKLFN